jgi:hypothetical protein
MNYVEGEDLAHLTLTLEDLRNWKAHPRPIIELVESESSEEEEYDPNKDRPPSPWKPEKSFFFTATVDKQASPELLRKCFEYDWKCSKLEKMLSSSGKIARDRVYNYLLSHYKWM